jgi:4-hydroxythreonine-4-phosphate dehydrogenase
VTDSAPQLTLAVTLGDPAGIGPEVVEAALGTYLGEHPTVGIELCGPSNLVLPMEARLRSALGGHLSLVSCMQAPFTGPLGVASAQSGQAALAALHAAIHLVDTQTGRRRQALVTAPINKQACALAGSSDLGHTELLGRTLGTGPIAMAFFTDRLNVVLATVHMPLRAVFAALTAQRVLQVAHLFNQSLTKLLGRAPRLGLAGLNPHASEGGLMGHEEAEVLLPAVAQAREQGIDLSVPQAPDTVFMRALQGDFDGVVALYHDQGLIPVKLLSFGSAVNATLGLRVVRTSPDHGTAYDCVGTQRARPEGMLAALRWADRLTL